MAGTPSSQIHGRPAIDPFDRPVAADLAVASSRARPLLIVQQVSAAGCDRFPLDDQHHRSGRNSGASGWASRPRTAPHHARTLLRARDLARLRGGAPPPALRALTAVAPLTGRERETVVLVAAGLSDQDVAARLVVSVRAVERHLYRAFAELGGAERGDAVLGTEGSAT